MRCESRSIENPFFTLFGYVRNCSDMFGCGFDDTLPKRVNIKIYSNIRWKCKLSKTNLNWRINHLKAFETTLHFNACCNLHSILNQYMNSKHHPKTPWNSQSPRSMQVAACRCTSSSCRSCSSLARCAPSLARRKSLEASSDSSCFRTWVSTGSLKAKYVFNILAYWQCLYDDIWINMVFKTCVYDIKMIIHNMFLSSCWKTWCSS